ncbi:hypothetical protein [Polaromonas glacialis]|uniref:hypothetical protein n=1 Tax=Polaromonas glacialis TaxID=866564 RepID=UPI00049555D3|nr:hypothetical protein [Polaromonas glacialis]
MNKSLSAVSVPVGQPASLAAERKKPFQGGQTAKREEQRIPGFRVRQSGKLHSRFAGYMAFGAAVFVSMIAAATVASHDVPLMLGGF